MQRGHLKGTFTIECPSVFSVILEQQIDNLLLFVFVRPAGRVVPEHHRFSCGD